MMKIIETNKQHKQYVLSVYPSEKMESCTVTVVLCQNSTMSNKKLHRRQHKKSIFALESSA